MAQPLQDPHRRDGHTLVAYQYRFRHPTPALAAIAEEFADWEPDFLHGLQSVYDPDERQWVVTAIVDERCRP